MRVLDNLILNFFWFTTGIVGTIGKVSLCPPWRRFELKIPINTGIVTGI